VNHLRFASTATTDLQEIHAYIAKDNLTAALRFIELLQKRCSDLSVHPRAGRQRNGLLPGMRSATEGDYVIFYQELSNTIGIEVVRVVHSARDIKKIFKQHV
jgi:toxin ParE1/3/4